MRACSITRVFNTQRGERPVHSLAGSVSLFIVVWCVERILGAEVPPRPSRTVHDGLPSSDIPWTVTAAVEPYNGSRATIKPPGVFLPAFLEKHPGRVGRKATAREDRAGHWI